RVQPAIRTVPPYYDHSDYISALANSVSTALDLLDWKPDIVLASFHGIPQSYADKGDPYPVHCTETFRLMAGHPTVKGIKFMQSFQSRVGTAEWLRPYTDETIAELAKAGTKRLVVITPGFASDCIETLEEIAMEGAEIFRENGGEKFVAIPCLNDNPDSIALLSSIILQELGGWSSSHR
ncbi:MAG: ferrochelatase, partial [Fimbriimonadaceae bacterium]|nr:ferrochelatase [Alphaproteobacteria bacterium]